MTKVFRFADLAQRADVSAAIDRIFFENAATTGFSNEHSRSRYRDLWLGRYLRHFPESCSVAFDDRGNVAGFLAGALISDEPPLSGPDYYKLFPGNFVEKFPAHLHVNVRHDMHRQGIGRALIDEFRAHCRNEKMRGFHAVTIANRYPAYFFVNCGMEVQARIEWYGSNIVFIAASIHD